MYQNLLFCQTVCLRSVLTAARNPYARATPVVTWGPCTCITSSSLSSSSAPRLCEDLATRKVFSYDRPLPYAWSLCGRPVCLYGTASVYSHIRRCVCGCMRHIYTHSPRKTSWNYRYFVLSLCLSFTRRYMINQNALTVYWDTIDRGMAILFAS